MERNTKKKKEKLQEAGITLVALVVTIIVLLILAGITISMVLGNNGVIQRAGDARMTSEKAQIIENIQTDILGQITDNKGETITENQLKAILDNYFEEFDDELPEDLSETSITLTLKSEYGGYSNIPLADIYNGKLKKEVVLPTDVYAALYNNGTLVFSNNSEDIDMSQVKTSYGNIAEEESFNLAYTSEITKVNILNKIVPTSCNYWFFALYNMTEIININNLDTRYLTDMTLMFAQCENLSVDVSNFDTSEVTTMSKMFSNNDFEDFGGVRSITGLGNLDTSNVTNMRNMFHDAHLTQENINDILLMCTKATKITENKTLSYIGVSRYYLNDVQSLSNYQDFLNAGWTTGY